MVTAVDGESKDIVVDDAVVEVMNSRVIVCSMVVLLSGCSAVVIIVVGFEVNVVVDVVVDVVLDVEVDVVVDVVLDVVVDVVVVVVVEDVVDVCVQIDEEG